MKPLKKYIPAIIIATMIVGAFWFAIDSIFGQPESFPIVWHDSTWQKATGGKIK